MYNKRGIDNVREDDEKLSGLTAYKIKFETVWREEKTDEM